MSGFGKKDLGLLLSDNDAGSHDSLRHIASNGPADPEAAAALAAVGEGFVPKVDASKRIARHRAGRAPAYVGSRGGAASRAE